MASPDNFSRYRNNPLIIDNGLLREERRTIYPVDYEPLRFVERPDTRVFVSRAGDTLDHLATVFYLTPKLYWVIADFQPVPILAPLEPIEPNTRLFIPSLEFVRSTVLRR